MKPALLTLVSLAFTLHTAAQGAKSRPAVVSLEGTVVNGQGGEPIRKATVQAISEIKAQGEPEVYSTTSDSEGHFKIDSMDPGRYRVFVERAGFIDVDRHRRRSDGVELTLEAGKPIKDFVVRAIPAAAVSGRVLDEDGDPMPNVAISVLRMGYSSCRPQLDTEGSERTNDLGEYRVGGLTPGKYFVSASPLPGYTSVRDAANRDTPSKPDMAYTTTYYPGVNDPSQAAAVEVHAGETLPVDFSLARAPSFRVRGIVGNLDSLTGSEPDTKGIVILRPTAPDSTIREGEIDRHGNFEVRSVPPGTYSISAITNDGGALSSTKTIEVASTDITNLRLTAENRSGIRGHLRVEGARNTDLTAFHVGLRSASQEPYLGAIGSDDARVKADGSFELAHVPPGVYDLFVVAFSSPSASYFIKQVRVGGRDVGDAGVRLGSEPVAVEVLASSATAQVEGLVTDHDQPVANATVVAVPNPTRRGVPEHYQTAFTDQHGRFRIRGLRPDDYTLLAWEDVESGAWCDPDFLKSYENSGQAVHLAESASSTVKLTAIPAPNPAK